MSTFQGEVTQASRGRIRDTSNSRKIHFGTGWLHIIIKGNNRKPQHLRLQQEQQVSVDVVSQHFLVYVLSDHSIILRNCTPGWRSCKIACKGGLFFTSPKQVTSPAWGPPLLCYQALSLRNRETGNKRYTIFKMHWSA